MQHTISKRARDLVALEERHGAHNYHPLDLIVDRAEGVWLWDVDGNKYLDCISAYSAVNQGHVHPRIRAALVDQSAKVTLTSRAMRNDRMPGFLEKLTRICGFEMALPTNTGVEAVETGIKLARRWGYAVKGIRRNAAEIVVFSDNFHGRTIAAISASTTPEYRREFGPFVPGFVSVPYGDADALERAIKPETCAILIEPIQGEGGVNVPPEGYLKRAWALCREHRALFIADEIQTGFGRTGDLFACDYDGIKPDVLLVGKALGGGFYPVSAALADAPLMRLLPTRRTRQHVRRKSTGLRRRRSGARRDRRRTPRTTRALRRGEDHAGTARAEVAADRRGSRARSLDRHRAYDSGATPFRGIARPWSSRQGHPRNGSSDCAAAGNRRRRHRLSPGAFP